MYLQRKLNSFCRQKLKLRHFTRLVITFNIFSLQFCFILHSKEETLSFLTICVTPIRSNTDIHTYFSSQYYILLLSWEFGSQWNGCRLGLWCRVYTGVVGNFCGLSVVLDFRTLLWSLNRLVEIVLNFFLSSFSAILFDVPLGWSLWVLFRVL